MPMPEPRPDEEQDDFMSRCMADSVMREDFENPQQRAAVCTSQWDDRNKAAGTMEFKTLAIEQATFTDTEQDAGAGSFSGIGAAFGNVDSGGDIIVQGAFAHALPDFIQRGFVPVGHNWLGLPVATIGAAHETPEGLWFSADFHSTQAAQDARTVIRERSERGKFVGLSIGFLPDYQDGVSMRDDGVRVISKVKELAEISIVTVPMNRQAGVTVAKGAPDAALPYAEHCDWMRSQLAQFVSHARSSADMRLKEGRVLSSSNRTRLAEIRTALGTAAGDLGAILAATDPEREERALAAELLAYRGRLYDVDVMFDEAV